MSFPTAARAILTALVSLCTAASALAQADTPLPASGISAPVPVLLPQLLDDSLAERFRELQQWTREYAEWKAWFVRWRNRFEPGWISVRARKERPEPPGWLPAACSELVDDTGLLGEGCRAWREWRREDYVTMALEQQVVQRREDLESPQKSVWWEHIHLDGLWPITQTGSSAFGVFGMHVTLNVSRRLQVFLAPGAILLRLPVGDGRHTWSVGTDWGFSYKILDFRMPAMGRASALHVNLARVWVLGESTLPGGSELYLAGFSLTFKPHSNRPAAR